MTVPVTVRSLAGDDLTSLSVAADWNVLKLKQELSVLTDCPVRQQVSLGSVPASGTTTLHVMLSSGIDRWELMAVASGQGPLLINILIEPIIHDHAYNHTRVDQRFDHPFLLI